MAWSPRQILGEKKASHDLFDIKDTLDDEDEGRMNGQRGSTKEAKREASE